MHCTGQTRHTGQLGQLGQTHRQHRQHRRRQMDIHTHIERQPDMQKKKNTLKTKTDTKTNRQKRGNLTRGAKSREQHTEPQPQRCHHSIAACAGRGFGSRQRQSLPQVVRALCACPHTTRVGGYTIQWAEVRTHAGVAGLDRRPLSQRIVARLSALPPPVRLPRAGSRQTHSPASAEHATLSTPC